MKQVMAALTDMVVGMEPRLQAIETKLHNQLQQCPDDVNVIWCLAENYRKRGNLSQALAGYQRLLSLNPEHTQAMYLQQLLTGQRLGERESGFQPSPFVLLDNFLNEQQQQNLWDTLQKHHHSFEVTKTLGKAGEGIVDDYRSSELLPKRVTKAIRQWFLLLVQQQIELMVPRLGLQPFEPDNIKPRAWAP